MFRFAGLATVFRNRFSSEAILLLPLASFRLNFIARFALASKTSLFIPHLLFIRPAAHCGGVYFSLNPAPLRNNEYLEGAGFIPLLFMTNSPA
jgi:hypothetical protein